MKTWIHDGTIVNEGRSFKGSLLLNDDCIEEVIEGIKAPRGGYDREVDATGSFLIPGVIDEHVHFREPGLTKKADIESESRAAACGGVTSYLDMPNTVPQTTTPAALADKYERGAVESHVNYGFFYGATNANAGTFKELDRTRIPGIKLFMGASTGNMLVDKRTSLHDVFEECARLHLPVMTHCEDSELVSRNMKAFKVRYGDDPDVACHPLIRSEEACYASSSLAVQLAREMGTRLHIAHISTARELELLTPWTEGNALTNGQACADVMGCHAGLPQITGEAVIAHLWFSDEDYATRGALIKCNPAVKTASDRDALRRALANGLITAVGTDHAPHQAADKQGGCCRAASGMPTLQFSLVTMLELVEQGVLSLERLVWLMCHNPARLFSITRRGFLRPGYKADITMIRHCDAPWTLTPDLIQSKCGWSPLTGTAYHWQVAATICNGHLIYKEGRIVDNDYRGEALRFRMEE